MLKFDLGLIIYITLYHRNLLALWTWQKCSFSVELPMRILFYGSYLWLSFFSVIDELFITLLVTGRNRICVHKPRDTILSVNGWRTHLTVKFLKTWPFLIIVSMDCKQISVVKEVCHNQDWFHCLVTINVQSLSQLPSVWPGWFADFKSELLTSN